MPEQINKSCTCSYPCSRHGNCAACQEYHYKDGSLTNCGKDGAPRTDNSVDKGRWVPYHGVILRN
jgi:hypothetical protein